MFNEEECIRTLKLLSGEQRLEEMPIVIRLIIIWKSYHRSAFRISGNKW